MNETLAAIVLVLKNLAFNVVTVLTVLVAFGNELRRRHLSFSWLEERQVQVRRAWFISLGSYLGLAVLYALLVHQPAPLVLDVLTMVAMLGAVSWLNHRGGRPASRPSEDLRDPFDDDYEPRRPLRRTPRPEPTTDPPERTPRRRRRPTAAEEDE